MPLAFSARPFGGHICNSTFPLQMGAILLMIFSSVSSILLIVSLGIDELYTVRNDQNIYLLGNSSVCRTSSGPSNSSNDILERVGGTSEELLFTQIDASVGLLSVCISGSCSRRSALYGAHSLMPRRRSYAASLFCNLEAVGTAYGNALGEFIFGYDIAEDLGTQRLSIKALCVFAWVATILGLFFQLVLCSVSAAFSFLMLGKDMLSGNATLDRTTKRVTLGGSPIHGARILAVLQRHLQLERPMVHTLLGISIFSTVFTFCAMEVAVEMVNSKMKSGASVCNSFYTHLHVFISLATQAGFQLSSPTSMSCATGATFWLLIVAFILSALALLTNCFTVFFFHKCHRRAELLKRESSVVALLRMEEIHLVVDGLSRTISTTVGGGDDKFAGRRSGASPTLMQVANSSLPFGQGKSGAPRAAAAGNSNFSFEGEQRPLSAESKGSANSRSVGSGIRFYQKKKRLQSEEASTRTSIENQAVLSIQLPVAISQKIAAFVGVFELNDSWLRSCIGPMLQLHLTETDARQHLIKQYASSLNSLVNRALSKKDVRDARLRTISRSLLINGKASDELLSVASHYKTNQGLLSQNNSGTPSFHLDAEATSAASRQQGNGEQEPAVVMTTTGGSRTAVVSRESSGGSTHHGHYLLPARISQIMKMGGLRHSLQRNAHRSSARETCQDAAPQRHS